MKELGKSLENAGEETICDNSFKSILMFFTTKLEETIHGRGRKLCCLSLRGERHFLLQCDGLTEIQRKYNVEEDATLENVLSISPTGEKKKEKYKA